MIAPRFHPIFGYTQCNVDANMTVAVTLGHKTFVIAEGENIPLPYEARNGWISRIGRRQPRFDKSDAAIERLRRRAQRTNL